MNYGKEYAAKQSAQLQGRRRKKRHSAGLAIIRLSLICIIAVIVVSGIIAYLYAKNLIDQLPDVSTIDISPTGYMSTVYDSDGNETASILYQKEE